MARQAVLALLTVMCVANVVAARNMLADVHKAPNTPSTKAVADNANEKRFAFVFGGPKRHMLAEVHKAPNTPATKAVAETSQQRFALVSGGPKRHMLAEVHKAPNTPSFKGVADNNVEARFAFVNRGAVQP
jgi:hypothetical protein